MVQETCNLSIQSVREFIDMEIVFGYYSRSTARFAGLEYLGMLLGS